MTTDLPPGLVTAEHLALAAELADAAGAVIRPYFRAGVEVDDKADASPVTIADREAELAMRRLIEARFPDHGIFGEEHGIVRGDADFVWILDPVDGTKSFVAGLPLFVTLIALTWRGKPILGVIDQPIMNERWIGAQGHGTTLNGKPVHVRQGRELSQAIAFFLPHAGPDDPDEQALDALRRRIKLFRLGGDGYAYALLASGFVDVIAEPELQPYDFAAVVAVIEGAGGLITDWEGRPLDARRTARVLAAGDPALLRAASEVLTAG